MGLELIAKFRWSGKTVLEIQDQRVPKDEAQAGARTLTLVTELRFYSEKTTSFG